MYIKVKTYFDSLGIPNDGTKKSLHTITDEIVEEAYCDKLIELYIQLQEVGKCKTNKEKDELEDILKQKLNRQLANMTTKAKIIVTENMIDEYGKSENLKENSIIQKSGEIQKGMLKEAYEELKTKEKRTQYISGLSDKKTVIDLLESIIENYGGDINKEIESKKIDEGNVAKEVKKVTIPEYDNKYQDEEIKLLRKSIITFQNGGYFTDKVSEYFMYKERNKIVIGCSFYGDINIKEMENPKYRIALCQAIKQNLMEEETHLGNYIGSIEKGKDGYYILKDAGQKSAVRIYEEQQAEERRKSIKLKERKQGEGR